MKLGLKGKMLLVVISLLSVSFISVGVVGYILTKNNITNQSENQLILKSDFMKEKLNNFFSQRQVILQSEARFSEDALKELGEYGAKYLKARQNIKARFILDFNQLKEEYGIIDVYIGYPDGSIDCGSGWIPDDPSWKANQRPWYKAALDAKGKLVYTDIYIDSDTKKPVVTLSQAIKKDGDSEYGVVAMDVGLAQLDELFSKEKIGETGYPFVLDKDGRFIIHPQYAYNEDMSKSDTIFNIGGGSLKEIGKKLLSENSEVIRGNLKGETKVYYSEYIKGLGFYIVSTINENDFTKDLNKLMALIAAIMVGSILFFIIFIVIYIGYITGTIKTIVEGMKQMAAGNLNQDIKVINQNDELGELSESIYKMQCSVRDIIRAIIVETDTMDKALIISHKNISELTENIEDASSAVEQLSIGMEETASSTQEINATSAEIENAVETIAGKALEGAISASEISKKALGLKDSSKQLENEANETRTNIKKEMDVALEKIKAVERIKNLSDAILQISSQTNLLALNAAIESARAGEAGKGFSVVADQIRKLAEGSETTVNEIQNTVNSVFEAVNNLANISKDTLDYIETKVVESYKESVVVGENYDKDAVYINGLVTELSTTSEELLASIKTVSEAINEISRSNTEGAEGTSSIADKVLKIKDRANEVNAQADYVKQSADNLKNLVLRFKV